MPEEAGEPSADFGVRSGLSVTSVLHRHKRKCDGSQIGTQLPAKTTPRRLFLFSLFLGFFNGFHGIDKLFCLLFHGKQKRRYRRRALTVVKNNFHDFQEIITTIVNKKLNYLKLLATVSSGEAVQ